MPCPVSQPELVARPSCLAAMASEGRFATFAPHAAIECVGPVGEGLDVVEVALGTSHGEEDRCSDSHGFEWMTTLAALPLVSTSDEIAQSVVTLLE